MRTVNLVAFFALLALSSAAVVEKDRTITKVVKLLQGMLDQSVTEGDEERKIYAKFKCYCDTSDAEKTDSIKELTEQIELLESKIAETQGDTGEQSSDCAQLKADMADNKAARDEATTLRNKENDAFIAEKADLKKAIQQMADAIDTLSKVGADQTKSTGADNKQFMAGKGSLLSLQSSVSEALNAASALMTPAQRSTATSFLQGPFTGTYTSQSAVVMGIIKSMRDTFKSNLGDAIVTEDNSQEAYDKFMKTKNDAFKEMDGSYQEKQKSLSDNDKLLSSSKSSLSQAQKQKASDEAFMDKLTPLCADKAKGYANRKLLRANEEAAIAEAISILNSDDAFASFGATDATSKASFLQLRSVRKDSTRLTVQNLLQKAAKDTKSARLSKVVASLQAENPFEGVLGEIAKMIDLIGQEGDADQKKLDWCNKERTENDDSLAKRKKEIIALDSTIDKLSGAINDKAKGLKVLIQETEQSLTTNVAAQTTETAERTTENLAYQKDVRALVGAQGILTKAIKVLKAYYDDLAQKLADGEALVQEDPKTTGAWKGDGDFTGQSSKGNAVIGQLEFILEETVKEENTAHADEEKSQHDYEDSMQALTDEQAASEKSLSDLQETLATTEKDLLDAQESLKDTTDDKESLDDYLLKIKPGCDFITTNFDLREKNRATEKSALQKATRLIKETPAYKTAVNEATVESYGDCKTPCVKDVAHVKCKSCQADVTIPAYCAGHKGTKGC